MTDFVESQDMPSSPVTEDQGKRDTLITMQMEALCIKRRDILSTTDFKENKANYVSTKELESRRLMYKGRMGEEEATKLKGWNYAWTRLQDDGTDSQSLRAVNEGLGQTHRARLMSDSSVQDYASESITRAGEYGGRSGHGDRGGRSRGKARRVTAQDGKGMVKGKRTFASQDILHQQPVTRVRIPKSTTTQPNMPRRQQSPMLTAVSAMKPAKGSFNVRRVADTSAQRPIYNRELAAPNAFMEFMNVGREKPREESGIEITHSLANNPKGKAAELNRDTSISNVNPTTSYSDREAKATSPSGSATGNARAKTTVAAGKPVVVADPKADLMDLDAGQETMQPVLQFTASTKQPSHPVAEDSVSFDQTIEALKNHSRIGATELKILKEIQAQVHARRNPRTPVKDDPCQDKYIRTDLEYLRPASTTPKVTTGIARKFTEQQKAFLIGEHVHKTRYHTAASLTEDFEKLTISDETPIKSTGMDHRSVKTLKTTSSKKPPQPAASIYLNTETSTINPFGSPPAKNKGPSLPAYLSNQKITADHGAAARAQYLGDNDVLAPVSKRQSLGGLSAPTHPPRRNRINETGFIALAENCGNIAERKKGEVSLLVAQKRL